MVTKSAGAPLWRRMRAGVAGVFAMAGLIGRSGPAHAVPPAEPVCLAVPEFTTLDTTWLDGTVIGLCAGYEPSLCVTLDVATGVWKRHKTPTEDERLALATRVAGSVEGAVELLDAEAIAAAGGVHTLCAPSGEPCHPVKLAAGRPVWRSFNADRTQAVYTLHVGAAEMDMPDSMVFQIFDTATGKQLKRHTYRDRGGNYRCGGARFVDRWLLLGVDVCAGPGGEAWLLDPRTGRKAAQIGGKGPFGGYEPQPHVTGDTLAVLEQNGTRFAIHDRKTGKFQRILDLLPDEQLETEPYGNRLWTLPSGDLVIPLSGSSTGTVLEVDGKTLVLKKKHRVDRCPMP